jgi:hypothetical protein
VVDELNLLEASVAPQESRAQHMQRSTRHHHLVVAGNIQIRQVAGEKEIARLYSGTEKQGSCPPQKHDEFRQVPGVFEEESLLAHAGSLHVPQTVEDQKSPAVFKNARAVIDWRL